MYLYFFVVETRNRTLEETAALFDGEEVTEKLAQQAISHTGATEFREDGIDEKSSGDYVPAHQLGKA